MTGTVLEDARIPVVDDDEAIVAHLKRPRHLQLQLEEQKAALEQAVRERTRELEQARLEILDRLALAGEFRDDETQEHAQRIGRAAGLLAAGMELADGAVERIRRAAPLHDIGKIGIPDAILLKPARLTPAELETVKRHATIGAQLLSGSRSELLREAEQIALTHHERWDGGGYPSGLSRESIPLSGRIVAVGDVFDALTHERPYKRAWPVERAVEEICSQSGRQFDPAVVEVFDRLDHRALLAPVEPSAASVSPAEPTGMAGGGEEGDESGAGRLGPSQALQGAERLTSDVAHDLNQLLSVVLGYARVVGWELDEEDPLRQDVAEIQRAAERAVDLVRRTSR